MRKLVFFLFGLFIFNYSSASHVVGGDLTYVCLGNNTYEFMISIYRDCLPPSQGGGNPAALESDNPAFISIYNGNNFFSFDSVYFFDRVNIPANFSNECINNPPATCINRIRFRLVKVLPPNANPYTVIYQRCCRNETVNNILAPGITGATYFCTVPPPPANCNNSAVFKNFPPQIICAGNPFVYDHSATDPDADSLSYGFCDALKGGDPNDPKPALTSGFLPVLSTVNYRAPYSSAVPMAGNPVVQIDPVTGVITGTPNIQGRFVVTVCCYEWRNGAIINVTTREFQFVVTNCSKAVVANIPQLSDEQNTFVASCKSFTVNFINKSSGGFSYFWDFGVEGILSDTSNLFEPTFTYPDTGTYRVKLIVNRGTTCPDSIIRLVKVYPLFNTDFSFAGNLCPENPIQFNDLSTATFQPINFWAWNFDDGNTSSLQNPIHVFGNQDKVYNVSLISGNVFGCRDTARKSIDMKKVKVFAGNDTVIVRNTPITLFGQGASQYEWTPSSFLDNPFSQSPMAIFADTGRYTYILKGVTSNGCVDNDTITITVASGPYLTVPNAFTPNGDGNNDIFKILAAGYKELKTFRIFNRWGEQVFATTNFRLGWDGKHKGRDSEVGNYYWVVTAIDLDGNEQLIKGDLTLIR